MSYKNTKLENSVTEDTAKRKTKLKSPHVEHIRNNKDSNLIEKELKKSNTHKQNGDINNKKKKNKNATFEVEHVLNVAPSQQSTSHKNLKRKLNDSENDQIPVKNKKNKNNNNAKMYMKAKKNKDFKNFKKDKFRNKKDKDKSSDNPLSQLSDERLKAYGLNPKKYKNFLKYKKF